MTPRGRTTLIRLAVLLAIAGVGFALFQETVRRAETWAATRMLGAADAGEFTLQGPTVIVRPDDRVAFRAIVTPSCSSLASVLAVGCLASLARGYSRRRKLSAIGVAMATIVLGNVLRIAGSLLAGLIAGSGSLVLFHDSVGNVFSFAYTLGGYILMLYLLLPKTGEHISGAYVPA